MKARISGQLDAYSDTQITTVISRFESIAERYRGVAYTTRTASEQIYARPLSSVVQLSHPKVQSITSITADTTDVVAQSPHLTVANEPGQLTWVLWPYGVVQSAVVVYTHGYSSVPELILEACTEYTIRTLGAQASGTSRDVISQAFDGGSTRYSTPDWNAGRPTGFLACDANLNAMPDYRPVFG